MAFTDIFIKRPVLATVVSLFILVLGLRSVGTLPILQYPFTENAVVTVTTVYTGATPDIISGFITSPLENSIAQANGIDYMTSTSTQGVSTIQANLKLNYDPSKALADINTKVNAVLNQLPKQSQQPILSVTIGQSIDSMYIGFYSSVLHSNQITDFLVRNVQPKLQAIDGVQTAEILGQRLFAMRAWLDPIKLAGFHLTPTDVATQLANNNFISAVGRTQGNLVTMNLTVNTGLESVDAFKNLILKSQNGAMVKLGDVATVSLGSQNYDTAVQFDGQPSVYIGIKIAPAANLLDVIAHVKQVFPTIQSQLPEGLNAKIVYDASAFVNSSIHEVLRSLLEALIIVTAVIFLFLGSIRSVIIPVIAMPLSLIGTFFIMLLLGYSINLLTLLALVLAIGLVVDDAIIVVENIYRHIEEGMSPIDAALLGTRELAGPIIAISVVLIAVYLPIGFMGGLTGALFTEFAFTLAGAVGISAIVALTLSPMMCSRLLSLSAQKSRLITVIDHFFHRLQKKYLSLLHCTLDYLPVITVFAAVILSSNYFLFVSSSSELAPQEDQGIVLAMLTAAPNAALAQTQVYSRATNKVFFSFPETEHTFMVDGSSGLNSSIGGMVLKPWDQRDRTTNQLQPELQNQLNGLSGARVAAFQMPSLPGGGSGLPVQFVLQTSRPFSELNVLSQDFMKKAQEQGIFLFLDSDLKYDKAQSDIRINRAKAAELGLTMQDVGNALGSALSEGYVNYFNFAGRSYQVIPEMHKVDNLNPQQLLSYYITTSNGLSIPLSTIASVHTAVIPQSLNHFQQLNSATLSGVTFPNVTMADTLNKLKAIAKDMLPQDVSIDYGGQSRQFIQEKSGLLLTFFFALIIIYLSLAAQFESFLDPLIILISVPMSICGAMIFISLGIGGATLNIYTEVGLVTLIGLISKHGILIVQFANDLQRQGKSKREAIETAASIRLRPILMTTAAMVLGVVPLITATGAGAVSRFDIGLVVSTGISIGTLFTLWVVPGMYLLLSTKKTTEEVI